MRRQSFPNVGRILSEDNNSPWDALQSLVTLYGRMEEAEPGEGWAEEAEAWRAELEALTD